MIRLQDCVPEVYYNKSRDFQFIGRLFDLVLNSVKTNTDIIYNLPINNRIDAKLLDLLALTLGFKSKHSYNTRQLTSLCMVFPLIIKNKGSLNSILIAGQALLSAEGLKADFKCELANNILKVYIPPELTDVNLFKDLLDYILPAGISCYLIKSGGVENNIQTNLYINPIKVLDNTLNETWHVQSKIFKADEDLLPDAQSDGKTVWIDNKNNTFINNIILKTPISNEVTKIINKEENNNGK